MSKKVENLSIEAFDVKDTKNTTMEAAKTNPSQLNPSSF